MFVDNQNIGPLDRYCWMFYGHSTMTDYLSVLWSANVFRI